MNEKDEPVLIFMYGYPASGKTTWSNNFIKEYPNFNLISADKVREELYGSQDSYGDSMVIYTKILYEMRKLLKENKNVIYDATNLWKQYRLDYLLNLNGIDCYKKIVCLEENKEICVQRHLRRGRNIPIEKLMPYFDIDEFPDTSEGWNEIIKLYPPSKYYATDKELKVSINL